MKRAILYAGVRLVNCQFDIFGLTITAVRRITGAWSALVQDYRATAARGQLVSLVVDRTVCHRQTAAADTSGEQVPHPLQVFYTRIQVIAPHSLGLVLFLFLILSSYVSCGVLKQTSENDL